MLDHPFHELDDLVLHLKGLVLIQGLRKKQGAESDELTMFTHEIAEARDRLAEFVRHGDLPLAA